MVKILAALSILNSSGATEKVAAPVARATCSGASHSSALTPTSAALQQEVLSYGGGRWGRQKYAMLLEIWCDNVKTSMSCSSNFHSLFFQRMASPLPGNFY